MIIFRSSALYHAVAKWTPLEMKRDDIFTPGRISWVYFNHRYIVEALEHKPKGWFTRTAGGFLEAAAGPTSVNGDDKGDATAEATVGEEDITRGGKQLGRGHREKFARKRYGDD